MTLARKPAQQAASRTIETAREVLQSEEAEPQVLMINLARGNDQLERLHFEAANPTFLVWGVKK